MIKPIDDRFLTTVLLGALLGFVWMEDWAGGLLLGMAAGVLWFAGHKLVQQVARLGHYVQRHRAAWSTARQIIRRVQR